MAFSGRLLGSRCLWHPMLPLPLHISLPCPGKDLLSARWPLFVPKNVCGICDSLLTPRGKTQAGPGGKVPEGRKRPPLPGCHLGLSVPGRGTGERGWACLGLMPAEGLCPRPSRTRPLPSSVSFDICFREKHALLWQKRSRCLARGGRRLGGYLAVSGGGRLKRRRSSSQRELTLQAILAKRFWRDSEAACRRRVGAPGGGWLRCLPAVSLQLRVSALPARWRCLQRGTCFFSGSQDFLSLILVPLASPGPLRVPGAKSTLLHCIQKGTICSVPWLCSGL